MSFNTDARIQKMVLVTRPEHQAKNFCDLLIAHNIQTLCLPTIEIQAHPLDKKSAVYIANIETYHYLFFISVNAVNFALQAINGKIERLKNSNCIAVGKATQQALVNAGIKRVRAPNKHFNSEAILKMAELADLTKQSCLIIRGVGGREHLAIALNKRNPHVIDTLELYRRTPPKIDCNLVADAIQQKTVSTIVIYSGAALQNLIQLLTRYNIQNNLLKTPLIVISHRIADLAKNIGFTRIITAAEASDVGMMHALLNGEECG